MDKNVSSLENFLEDGKGVILKQKDWVLLKKTLNEVLHIEDKKKLEDLKISTFNININ